MDITKKMELSKRIEAWINVGKALEDMSEETLQEHAFQAKNHNAWFTTESVMQAFEGLKVLLKSEPFIQWAEQYSIQEQANKKIGVIMAGNIPMVGIHDMVCVLLSSNILVAKLSSQDPYLIRVITQILIEIEPEFKNKIIFTEQLKEIDAVIATGSDNSARYFEYYFSKHPHIIRKNRVGCAILNGEETPEELEKLGDDMLMYFGLGCRNISTIFIPANYDLTTLLKALEAKAQVAQLNHKFANNYDYNKSIFLVNQTPHLDNGGLMFRESDTLVSPISVIHYQTYNTAETLHQTIESFEGKIQCIVANKAWYPQSFDFGEAQFPAIDDYADGVDTMAFLESLK